jgi:hypothetical protein
VTFWLHSLSAPLTIGLGESLDLMVVARDQGLSEGGLREFAKIGWSASRLLTFSTS